MNNQDFLNIAKSQGTVEATDSFLNAWEESLKEEDKVENNEATIFLTAYTFAFENGKFDGCKTFEDFKKVSFIGSPVRVSRKTKIALWKEKEDMESLNAQRKIQNVLAGDVKRKRVNKIESKYENMILDFQDSEVC